MGTSNRPFHRAVDTGPAFWGPGDRYTFLATGAETNGAYFQLEALVPPGGGAPPHIHHREDETFYLVEGNLEIRLGDQTVSAAAGDFVNIPKGTPHSFVNSGQISARMIATFVPAGFERFFEEVLEPATDRHASPPPITEELIQRMGEAAARHNLEMLPPEAGDEGA
jgi:mannose-6-phosphate isomerase-like protein (cupin superfamily)